MTTSGAAMMKVQANKFSRFAAVTIDAKGFASEGPVYPEAWQEHQAELFRAARGAPSYFAQKIGLGSRASGGDSS